MDSFFLKAIGSGQNMPKTKVVQKNANRHRLRVVDILMVRDFKTRVLKLY